MKKLTKKQKMILGGVIIATCAVVLLVGGDHIISLIGNNPVAGINRPFGA